MTAERFANLLATPASDADDNGLVGKLGAAVATAPAAGTVENWTLDRTVDAALRGGLVRCRVDNELVLMSVPSNGVSPVSVTRGIEDSTTAVHALNAKVRNVFTAQGIGWAGLDDVTLTALEQGMRGMTFTAHDAHSNGGIDVNSGSIGMGVFWKVRVTPSPAPLTTAITYLHTVLPAGFTSAKIFAVSYETGQIMGRTAELVSNWQASTGRKEHALTADAGQSLVVPGRMVIWAMHLLQTTGAPLQSNQFARVDTPSGAIQSAEGGGWWNGAVSVNNEPGAGDQLWVPGTRFTENYQTMIWAGFA